MTKYVNINGIIRYYPNGYEAAEVVAEKAAKPKKKKA